MKLKINLDSHLADEIRLYQNDEYLLVSEYDIVASTSNVNKNYYSKCLMNGTNEVYLNVQFEMLTDKLYLYFNDRMIKVTFEYKPEVMVDHLDAIVPAFIEEEFPLFKKLMAYYLEFLNIELNPSHFIHNMEKLRDIDSTFDEFVDLINKEYLPYFKDTAVDKRLLSKYIIQFYNQRGTEQSILFLMRILFNEDVIIERGRDKILISSSKEQGTISDSSIVLPDNYSKQLYSYVINILNHKFIEYKKVLYSTVNPTGYLPFGRSKYGSRNVVGEYNLNYTITGLVINLQTDQNLLYSPLDGLLLRSPIDAELLEGSA